MSDILYDPNAIDGLGDIANQNKQMAEIRQNIEHVFTSLKGVYTGKAAQALDQAYTVVNGQLEDAQSQLANVQQQAINHHHGMHDLDNHLSQAF